MKLNRLILILLLMIGIVYGNDLIVTNNEINCIIKNTLNKNYDLSEKGVWKYALKDKRDSRYIQLNTIDGENVIEIDADQKSGSYGIVLSTKKLISGFKENLKEGDYLTYIRLKANDDITVNIVSGNSEFLNTAKDYKVKIGKSFQWIKIPLKYKTILGYTRDHVGIGFKDIKNKIYIDKIIFIKPDQCQDIKQYSINIIPDSLSKKIPTSFNFDINVSDNVGGLKVETTKGETATVIRGKGGFPDGNINITPIDNNTWKVTYDVSKLSPTTATSNNIGLTFYALDSDGNTLVQKTLTVKAYKQSSVNLEKIVNYLNKSFVLKKLDLGNKNIRYAPFSRAEAAVMLYEFLKLKDPNFALPYGDVEFYKNPFADIDPNSKYYKAVITLANYKGNDNTTVFTDKYGVFNPLHNVTRFEFVKMIVEGLNLPKSKDFSNIKGFSDYSQLANDAKVYYSTAVKYGLIKGDNNKLLPYDKLTMFQALTILQRALNINFISNQNQFNAPDLATGEIGNPLGVIPEDQDYDPTIKPIKINNIITQKEGNCTKLTVISTIDNKAKGKDYYVWSANFGYFEKNSTNNKTVIFCPSTKEPNVNYNIHLLGGDGYMNFSEYNITLNKDNYKYVSNIADLNSNELEFNMSLSVKSHIMRENHLFVISKIGSLYERNLNIGLEKVAVTLQNKDGETYTVDNVKWDNNSIYFVVPSIKSFYGKFVSVKVNYGTNDKYESKTFNQILYQENFIIKGSVQADENGNYPNYVTINSKQISVINGKFMYIAPNRGNYKISINKNYQTINVALTDENPRPYVYIDYINTYHFNETNQSLLDSNLSNNNQSQNNIKDNDNNNSILNYNIQDNNFTNISNNKGKIIYTFNFSDLKDFNKTSWININNVNVDNGYLELINNYDNDPRHYIKYNINTENISKLILEKETKLTTNDEYTESSTTVSNSKGEQLSIVYNNYHYNNGDLSHQIDTNNTEHFYLFNRWDYKNSNSFEYKISDLLEPVWNKWFYERLVIDYDKKTATYFISKDGINYKQVSLNNIHLQRDKNTTIEFEAWDWASGSTQDIKKLKISLIKNSLKLNQAQMNFIKGWNLVSLPINTEIPITEFNQSSVKIIWKWDNYKKEWMVWSPNKNILNLIKKYKFEIIKNISGKDGFWIYVNNKLDKFLNINNPINQINYLTLYKGWNLVGFDRDINATIFDNNGIVEYLWKYGLDNPNFSPSVSKWELHISNGRKYPLNVAKFNIIKKNEGIWIKVNKDINLSTNLKSYLPPSF